MNLSYSAIEPALKLALIELTRAFESATEQSNLTGVFSAGFDYEGAINWLKIEAQQKFPNFPTVELLPSQTIAGGRGAYATATNTIYLATEYIEQHQSNPRAIAGVILEEYGHYLDAWFNHADTPGDEGELFAHFVQNQPLTTTELDAIRQSDDTAKVEIGGLEVAIEQSKFGDNPAFDLIGLTELRNDRQFAGIDGSGLSIAVIDTGLDTDHPLLADNYLGGYDFVDGDRNPSNRERHGTHVTGILGATDETIGVAPDVGLISLRALNRDGDGDLSKIADALMWVLDNQAEYNITAVNLSLGGGFFSSESELTQGNLAADFNRLQQGIQNLEAAGVTVVAAAGNNYFRNQDRVDRANLSFPAISSTLAVGAVWQDGIESTTYWQDGSVDYSTGADRITGFSQRLDADNVVFAPGAIITSTVPGGGLGESAGTSEATPHVTGAVALMQEAALEFGDRLLTPDEVSEILRSTADTIIDGDDEDDNVNNTNLAYLRINVYSAISEIKRRADLGISYSYSEDSSYVAIEGRSNETIADAGTITLTGDSAIAIVRETIGRDGTENRRNDVDLFNFQLASPGSIALEVLSDPESPSDFDSYLRLFDAAGTEIAANDDISLSAGNTFSRIETELEAGTYTVGVSGFRNDSYDPNVADSGVTGDTGNYALRLSLNGAEDTELLTSEELNLDNGLGSSEDGGDLVYRFTHRNLGVHFYTSSIEERERIQNNSSEYEFRGEYFESASEPEDLLSGAKPVYRFLNRRTGVHLYTISENERNYIRENLSNYRSEGIVYYGYEEQQSGTVPLYRIYDNKSDIHLFTTSIAERNRHLSNFGDRQAEGNNGVAFYVEALESV